MAAIVQTVQTVVLQAMTTCALVDRFEDGGIMFVRNAGIHVLQDYTMYQHKRPQFEHDWSDFSLVLFLVLL
jgi:hypothetical protein